MAQQYDSMEQLKIVTHELDSLRKQCEEYKDIILFQAKEIKNLRKSLSENICQRCKSSIDHTAAKEPEHFSTISTAANARWKPTNFPSCSPMCPCPNHYTQHYPTVQASTLPPPFPPTPCSPNPKTLQAIAAPGGPASPSQSSQNNDNIVASPIISFNDQVKKKLDVKLVHSLKLKRRGGRVRFSHDGKHMAATSGRATHIYDVATWKSICVLQDISLKSGDGLISGVDFSIDGIYLAASSHDKLIRVWEISRRHVRSVFKGHRDIITSVNFSPDQHLLASASFDRTVRIWSMRDGTSKVLASGESRFYSMAFSPDQMYLAAGGDFHALGVWNVQTGQLINWLEGHTSIVNSVSFMTDGKGLVSGSWDHTLKLWDTGLLQIDQQMRKDKATYKNHVSPKMKVMESLLDFTGHKSSIYSVAISPNGMWVASGSDDHSVCIWDAQNAEMQCTISAHKHSIWSVHFCLVRNYMASSDSHGQVRIWQCEEV